MRANKKKNRGEMSKYWIPPGNTPKYKELTNGLWFVDENYNPISNQKSGYAKMRRSGGNIELVRTLYNYKQFTGDFTLNGWRQTTIFIVVTVSRVDSDTSSDLTVTIIQSGYGASSSEYTVIIPAGTYAKTICIKERLSPSNDCLHYSRTNFSSEGNFTVNGYAITEYFKV